MKTGDKVELMGDHPWTGERGVIVGKITTVTNTELWKVRLTPIGLDVIPGHVAAKESQLKPV